MNTVLESILQHRSIRKYKDKAVEPETLDLLLQAANRAPSAGGLQNVSLVVIDDKEKLARLAKDTHAGFMKNAPMAIVSLVDQYRIKRLTEMFDAPFFYDNADSIFIGMWDAIVALHNITIAAESLGLGTCYVGLILETDNREILGIPDHVFAAGLVTIGYPDHKPDLNWRLPLEAIVHKNSYQKPTNEQLKEFYKVWLKRWDTFYAKLSDDKKKYWNEELGISNNVQYLTKNAYSEKLIKELGEKIVKNILDAKFEFK